MSAHQRLHRQHLRHGGREIELRQEVTEVATVVEFVATTMPITFDGPVAFSTVGEPVQFAPTTTQESAAEPTEDTNAPNDESNAISTLPTEILAPTGTEGLAEPTGNSLVVASSHRSSATAATAATSAARPTGTSAAESSTSQEGMSAGGKAGLAIGILLLVGTALALILFCLKKKKKQRKLQELRVAADGNEKGSIFEDHAPAPASASVRTARTLSTAPRLSLRPVTEFSPTLEAQRKSAANNLDLIAGAPTAKATHLAPTAQPVSAWERRGSEKHAAEDPFSDPVDPFGNHAATADVAVHPGNEKVAPISSAPTGPLPMAPTPELDSSTVVSSDAPAVITTNASPAGLAATVPKALSIKSERVDFDAVSEKPLPSPASATWTEDIPNSAPASPLPASGRQADAALAAKGPGPATAPGPNNVHRVQMDFKPSMDDELEIRAGQLVRMLHEYDDGWALCIRLDRSQQGVAPRSCLSKHPVKPRQGPPPQNRRPPPGARSPMGPAVPRPLTPNGGRNSPGPQQRGPPGSPAGRPRAASNAHPGQQRSMSPGPYNGLQKPPRPHPDGRRRSNSASQVMARRMSPPGSSPLGNNPSGLPIPNRKPVPGQAL